MGMLQVVIGLIFVLLLLSLLASSVVVFAFMQVLPGDPARVALGVSASEESVARLRSVLG